MNRLLVHAVSTEKRAVMCCCIHCVELHHASAASGLRGEARRGDVAMLLCTRC
jgi:hypothetical protein